MSPDPVPVTSEAEWLDALARSRLGPPDTAEWFRGVIVAAHPDDETLAVGGFLQELSARAVRLRIVVATDGEAAFPGLAAAERARLADTRREELHAALRAHGLGSVPVTWLAFPDSRLVEHERSLARALRPLLAGADASVVPWPVDPHPDHRAAGRAASAAAPEGGRVWSYPVWMWHWMRPDSAVIPWRSAVVQRLTGEQRARKSAGLAEFVSQTGPDPAGNGPVLPPRVLAHFERDVEVLFEERR
ncbi:LmbE family N-acetylglucosaminyl deacetylase [Actinopolyspora biskrensis]|uniref:LmbE family N-acetylglucosaminyl deacetylase n=1 Tax=Actinopolyspora biskrensis TaxID=1470178 RepID=A0A852Z1M9_9ACTN|nr:LmbE family N-acetylglucosaminyl deacetylase [Actinopolyspora biskrensis]